MGAARLTKLQHALAFCLLFTNLCSADPLLCRKPATAVCVNGLLVLDWPGGPAGSSKYFVYFLDFFLLTVNWDRGRLLLELKDELPTISKIVLYENTQFIINFVLEVIYIFF